MDSRAFPSVIPGALCHSRRPLSFPTPSVIPGASCHSRRPSVIPDAPLSFPTFLIGNPEFFPKQNHTNEETKGKRPWIPAKNRRE